MKQLVELQQHVDDFKRLNTEIVVVYREESEGIDGLKKIKEKSKTDFTLAVDLDKKNTAPYSNERRTFDNYVVDRKGVVRGIIDGTVRTRATSEQLLKLLKKIEAE